MPRSKRSTPKSRLAAPAAMAAANAQPAIDAEAERHGVRRAMSSDDVRASPPSARRSPISLRRRATRCDSMAKTPVAVRARAPRE